MLVGSATASADDIDAVTIDHTPALTRKLLPALLVFALGIRDTGVGISAHATLDTRCKVLDNWSHLGSTRRAVQAHGEDVVLSADIVDESEYILSVHIHSLVVDLCETEHHG